MRGTGIRLRRALHVELHLQGPHGSKEQQWHHRCHRQLQWAARIRSGAYILETGAVGRVLPTPESRSGTDQPDQQRSICAGADCWKWQPRRVHRPPARDGQGRGRVCGMPCRPRDQGCFAVPNCNCASSLGRDAAQQYAVQSEDRFPRLSGSYLCEPLHHRRSTYSRRLVLDTDDRRLPAAPVGDLPPLRGPQSVDSLPLDRYVDHTSSHGTRQ